jgi:hypothetical protein
MRRAALACILLAACSQPAAPTAPQEPGDCRAHEAAFPPLIGGSLEAVRAALEAMPGIRSIRVGGPNTPMTFDYRPDRATVLVEGGTVRRIACG